MWKRLYVRFFVKQVEEMKHMAKKKVQTVCRICGNSYYGQAGSYRCPRCREEDQRYKAHRERLKKNLPFYLKTDI